MTLARYEAVNPLPAKGMPMRSTRVLDPLSLMLAMRTLTVLVLVAIGSITTAGAICGDEIVEAPQEQCDGPNLVGLTCADLGYSGGTLACAPNCTFDTTGCTTACGNGLAEPTEQCDTDDLRGTTCVNLGYGGGTLGCAGDCVFDTSGCTYPFCGDGIPDAAEECDDGNMTSGDGCNEFCMIENCASDSECDNGFICDGVELCDPMFFICVPGAPVNCSDGDPCTFDSCDPADGACQHVPSGDGEMAAGADGRCDTLDDNLSLFGPDGMCGTGDDGAGDGVCSALDNCPQAWNPAQADSDADRAGDACDASACRSLTAYVTDFDRLLRVDVATGAQGVLDLPGSELADVEITEDESLAYVASGAGEILVVELSGGGVFSLPIAGIQQPWGLALEPAAGAGLFVTDSASGEVIRIEAGGGGIPVAAGLSQPRGIALDPSQSAVAYIAEYGSGELSQVNLLDVTQPHIARATGLSGPTGVALNQSVTTAYVTEADSGELSRVDLATGTVTLVTGALNNPQDLVLDDSGTIAYVVQSPGPVLAVDLATGAKTPITDDLPQPVGIALGNPAVVMGLPKAATVEPGMVLDIPVSLTDVTGQGVLSADFTVEFNPAVLSLTGVSSGSLTGGCTVTSNLAVPGRAVVSIFCTSELSGGGSLAQLAFDVVGEEGDSSPLHLVQGMLNEGQPSVCLEGGAFFIPVRIAGTVSYYRDHATSTEPSSKRVAGVDLNLGDPSVQPPVAMQQQVTGCGGDFLFPDVFAGGSYSLITRKAGDFGAAIDPFDASLNAQHVVGLISLTPAQRLAADVTGNGTLSSLDSARIAQFSVGIIAGFPVAALNGDWTFVPVAQPEPNAYPQYPNPPGGAPGQIQYLPLVESAENQDFLGVLFGDVSGNWQPPACSLTGGSTQQAAPGTESALKTEVSPSIAVSGGGGTLSLPTLTAKPGDIIQVPVTGAGVAQAVSFYLDLRYNANVLRLVQAQAGSATSGFSLTTNLQEPGRARLALFRATPAGNDGAISVLTFEVIGPAGSSSWLRLPAYTVNEGRIAVSVDEGRVQVERRLKGRQ